MLVNILVTELLRKAIEVLQPTVESFMMCTSTTLQLPNCIRIMGVGLAQLVPTSWISFISDSLMAWRNLVIKSYFVFIFVVLSILEDTNVRFSSPKGPFQPNNFFFKDCNPNFVT
jgi:hypothetical protein